MRNIFHPVDNPKDVRIVQQLNVAIGAFKHKVNTKYTRQRFRTSINKVLRPLKLERDLYQFLVVCDASNNPPNYVRNNRLGFDIYFQRTRSIDFIYT